MITANDYYKSIFGEKVYKISLDAGCTCPNRDGTIDTGGCIFCSQTGSGDFAASRNLSITEQIQQAKTLISKKTKAKKFIAYFQNFTNTYGDPNQLKTKWMEALSCPEIIGLAIGTRPDCLNDEILKVLQEMSEKTFLQIELGLQTTNENTARFIHRGFTTEVYRTAVEKLHAVSGKIHVVTHIIFGLPVPECVDDNLTLSPLSATSVLRIETTEDQLNTVKYAIDSGTDGLKITVLYVLKNTKLEKYYEKNLFSTLELDEYFENIKSALKIIPENIVIHRLTGDPPKNSLIAPLWTTDKKKILNIINNLK